MYIVRNIGMYLSRFRHFFAQTYTSSWFLAGIISTLARPLVKVEHVLSSWLKKEFESLWCFSVYREWSGMGKKSDIFFLMSCSTFLQDTHWFAGLRPASLLGLRLPNKLGVFATDTVGNLKFPGTKGTFRYNTVRKN